VRVCVYVCVCDEGKKGTVPRSERPPTRTNPQIRRITCCCLVYRVRWFPRSIDGPMEAPPVGPLLYICHHAAVDLGVVAGRKRGISYSKSIHPVVDMRYVDDLVYLQLRYQGDNGKLNVCRGLARRPGRLFVVGTKGRLNHCQASTCGLPHLLIGIRMVTMVRTP
jgi:hypothetical protein